jgi:outer membrane immunogenic protein
MIAGGQIGYNYQINPTWVVSLEGDLQWSGQKDSRSQSASSSGNSGFCLIEVQGICEVPARLEESATADSTLEARLRWFSTVRGRAGVLITPTLLLYGTGGLAFGGVKVSGSGTATDSATGCVTFRVDFCHTESVTSAFAFSQSKTKFGWTLGGGVEAALAANWSLKAEYLYMDLGSVSGSVPDNFGGTVSWDTGFTDHIVRVGLNYRFY